jgi:hypothetical protein
MTLQEKIDAKQAQLDYAITHLTYLRDQAATWKTTHEGLEAAYFEARDKRYNFAEDALKYSPTIKFLQDELNLLVQQRATATSWPPIGA